MKIVEATINMYADTTLARPFLRGAQDIVDFLSNIRVKTPQELTTFLELARDKWCCHAGVMALRFLAKRHVLDNEHAYPHIIVDGFFPAGSDPMIEDEVERVIPAKSVTQVSFLLITAVVHYIPP